MSRFTVVDLPQSPEHPNPPKHQPHQSHQQATTASAAPLSNHNNKNKSHHHKRSVSNNALLSSTQSDIAALSEQFSTLHLLPHTRQSTSNVPPEWPYSYTCQCKQCQQLLSAPLQHHAEQHNSRNHNTTTATTEHPLSAVRTRLQQLDQMTSTLATYDCQSVDILAAMRKQTQAFHAQLLTFQFLTNDSMQRMTHPSSLQQQQQSGAAPPSQIMTSDFNHSKNNSTATSTSNNNHNSNNNNNPAPAGEYLKLLHCDLIQHYTLICLQLKSELNRVMCVVSSIDNSRKQMRSPLSPHRAGCGNMTPSLLSPAPPLDVLDLLSPKRELHPLPLHVASHYNDTCPATATSFASSMQQYTMSRARSVSAATTCVAPKSTRSLRSARAFGGVPRASHRHSSISPRLFPAAAAAAAASAVAIGATTHVSSALERTQSEGTQPQASPSRPTPRRTVIRSTSDEVSRLLSARKQPRQAEDDPSSTIYAHMSFASDNAPVEQTTRRQRSSTKNKENRPSTSASAKAARAESSGSPSSSGSSRRLPALHIQCTPSPVSASRASRCGITKSPKSKAVTRAAIQASAKQQQQAAEIARLYAR